MPRASGGRYLERDIIVSPIYCPWLLIREEERIPLELNVFGISVITRYVSFAKIH